MTRRQEPEITIRVTDDGRLPMPGDAVVLTGHYDGHVQQGAIAVLSGQVGLPKEEYDACFGASVFRGRNHPYGLSPEFVSCSGGPLPRLRIDELTPTDRTHRLMCWRWNRNGPAAGCRAWFEIDVPVWEWKGIG